MSIRMSYGLQLALALVGGACLDLPNHECTHDTTHMMVGLHHHPDLLPLQGQLTAATSRQNRSSNRRGLSLDSYIGRLSLKGTWKGILEVSAFLVYYITILCSSTSQITRTSQQVWRVHLVYVASGITSSRQSSLADRPAFLPGTGITSSRQSSLADRPAFLPGTGPLRGL